MFNLDFGIRLDSPLETEKVKNNLIMSPFEFKPILTGILPQQPFKCTFIPEVLPV